MMIYAWFVKNKMINCFLERMNIVRMFVRRRSSEEMYAERFGGLLV